MMDFRVHTERSTLAPCFTDPRDRVLLAATPILPNPRFGTLPPVSRGQHQFIAAENGLFVQAESTAIKACLKVSDTIRLPYAPMEEYFELLAGDIPYELFEIASRRAILASPDEWAGLIMLDASGSYTMVEPGIISHSKAHIQYDTSDLDPERMVVDIHSHGHGKAYFSKMDNQSDLQGGIRLSCVLGECTSKDNITVVTRIVINGIFYAVEWTPWSS